MNAKGGSVKKYETQNIRNIALFGSKGVGKTTFVEAALFSSGATGRQGRIDEGNSIIDYDPIEISRKQSLSSKVTPLEWQQNKINLIDTPGYSDFIGDAVGAMTVTDVSVFFIDSVNGVEISQKRIYAMAKERNRPRVFIINKADNERSNISSAVASIKDKLEPTAALFQLPISEGTGFKGVVDLLNMKAYTTESNKMKEMDVPADMAASAKEARMGLMEAIAECDEALLEKYLEAGELGQEDLKKGMVKGIAEGKLSPIFICSAFANIGVDAFLTCVVNNFPSPLDMPAFKAKKADGSEVLLKADPKGPLCAHVFKITSDPGIGDVFFFRVYSGTVRAGEDVYNGTQSQIERMGHLIHMRGKERSEIDEAVAGDFAAVAKLKSTQIEDVFSTKNAVLSIDPIPFPKPVVAMAANPKTKKDQDKLGIGLSKLTELDPTFTYHVDKEFSETIVTAMGEIQIDVMMKRLKDRYGVEVELGKPHIAYRERITKKSEKQGKHKKQSGGHGQYGDCWLRLEPLPSGGGFQFVDAIVGGSIPGKYVPAVEKGVKEAMSRGSLAGYPVVDIKVTVYDGSYHDVDSSDMAFQIAGALAFRNAIVDAGVQLLEPIVDLEVYVPQENMGDISSDVSQRRGRVTGMDAGVLRAKVPMSELYQYSASLKSITSGAGTYSMHFSHYDVVPAHIAQKVVDEAKKAKEEVKA